MRPVQLLTHLWTLAGLLVALQIARADTICSGTCIVDGFTISGFNGDIGGDASGFTFTTFGGADDNFTVTAPYHWSLDLFNIQLSELYTLPDPQFTKIGVFLAVAGFGPNGLENGSGQDFGNASIENWPACDNCYYRDQPLEVVCYLCVFSSAEVFGHSIDASGTVDSLTVQGISGGYCDPTLGCPGSCVFTSGCPGSDGPLPPTVFTPEPGALVLLATVIACTGCALFRSRGLLCHPNTLAALRKVKNKQGTPVFPEINDQKLFGYPIHTSPFCDELQSLASSPQTTAKPLLFGDISRYIIRRVTPTLLVLRERFADTGEIAYVLFVRMDGQLVDGNGGASCQYLTTVY